MLASASREFLGVLDGVGERRANVGDEALEVGQHLVGPREDILRGFQQIGDGRRVGGDLGDPAAFLGLVEQLRLVQIGALQLDLGLAGETGNADIGLGRFGDRRQPVDLGIGDGDRRVVDVDIDALTSPTLTPLNRTALPRPSPAAEPGDAHAQGAVSPRSPIVAVQ